jgi:hypothetical protein
LIVKIRKFRPALIIENFKQANGFTPFFGFRRTATKPNLKGQGPSLFQAIHLLNQGAIRSGEDNCNGWEDLREISEVFGDGLGGFWSSSSIRAESGQIWVEGSS